jgi:uncharacterized protein YkwD/uncharacterized protein YraI
MNVVRLTRMTALAGSLSGLLLAGGNVAAAPVESPNLTHVANVVETADACLDDEEVNFLALINDYRAASGLSPLTVSASLSSAAAYHSVDMASNGYLDHTLSDGTGVPQNLQNFGYDSGTYGENIAAGMATAQEAMQIWQNSPEHNANMLNGQFGALGIGRAYSADSPYGWYWTTDFGDVSDGPGWLCGSAAPATKTLSLYQTANNATSTSDVNLRSGPGPDYSIVTEMPTGTAMSITGREQEGYIPVEVDGQYGWVATEWVQRGSVSLEQTADAPGTATTISQVELRSDPSSQGSVLTTIPTVATVDLTGEAQDGYLGVTFDGQQGWADAAFLQVAEKSPSATTLQATQTQPVDQATVQQAQTAAPIIGGQATASVNVNLRSQPSATAPVLSIVPAGSAVALTGSQANGYLNVRFNGQAGWIDDQYLQ